jgi:hypothetical protein
MTQKAPRRSPPPAGQAHRTPSALRVQHEAGGLQVQRVVMDERPGQGGDRAGVSAVAQREGEAVLGGELRGGLLVVDPERGHPDAGRCQRVTARWNARSWAVQYGPWAPRLNSTTPNSPASQPGTWMACAPGMLRVSRGKVSPGCSRRMPASFGCRRVNRSAPLAQPAAAVLPRRLQERQPRSSGYAGRQGVPTAPRRW